MSFKKISDKYLTRFLLSRVSRVKICIQRRILD